MNSSVWFDARFAARVLSRGSDWGPSVVSVVVRFTPRATLIRLPSCSTSISVRPVSSRSAASSRIKSLSKLPPGCVMGGVLSLPPLLRLAGRDRGGQRLDRKLVAYRPETADHTPHGFGDIRMMAKWLAGENVRQMHLDRRNRASQQRIQHGDRGMGEGPGIDDQPGSLCPRFLDPCYQLALMVALAKL